MNTEDRGDKQLSQLEFWAIYKEDNNKQFELDMPYLEPIYNVAAIWQNIWKKLSVQSNNLKHFIF